MYAKKRIKKSTDMNKARPQDQYKKFKNGRVVLSSIHFYSKFGIKVAYLAHSKDLQRGKKRGLLCGSKNGGKDFELNLCGDLVGLWPTGQRNDSIRLISSLSSGL
jgi:hypothetical protein